MYTEENLLLIRHFRNARVTGTEYASFVSGIVTGDVQVSPQ